MVEPKISVIVPIYNVEQYLRKCVDSILGQTYTNLEVILVDDGSPDGCPAICDEYAAQDKRVKVIHKPNGGLGDARNAGLDIATGDYIAFVDSDDYLEPTAYADMMSFLLENNLDVVFCAANVVEGGKIVEERFHYYPAGTVKAADEIIREALVDKIEAYAWNKLYSRHLWEKLRFPVGCLFEDVPISFRYFIGAEKGIGFTDKPLYDYIKNPTGLSFHRKPLTLYHLYLGNLEHYRYAKEHYPDLLPHCAALTARFAMGTYIDYTCCGYQELAPYLPEVEQFLQDNRGILKHEHYLPKAWHIALRLYYFSKPLFRFVYRIFIAARGKDVSHE